MPDIVGLEETGARDFQPRIPFVVVSYDGSVRYLEPVAFTTTCPINIAYFPFDTQVKMSMKDKSQALSPCCKFRNWCYTVF